jgi:glycosyltransferase involved in cell wall biosynthesis
MARLGAPLLQGALQRAKHRDRVARLAEVRFSDLVRLYQGAVLFVLPSLYEGFGLPVLEAMAAGTPVVAAREASIPEVGGDAITYFDPAAPGDLDRKLSDVLDMDAVSLDTLVARARERSRLFTWQKTADATVDALRSIAADR